MSDTADRLRLLMLLVDDLPDVVAIVGAGGMTAYLNRRARAALAEAGAHQPPPPRARARAARRTPAGELMLPASGALADAVGAVAADGRARDGLSVELPSGSRWRGRFWRLDSRHVAFVLHPEATRPAAVARLQAGLAVHPDEARLALQVAEGRTNREIARVLGVRETTIVGRLHALTRKLGVRGRVGLVARVVSELAGGSQGPRSGEAAPESKGRR